MFLRYMYNKFELDYDFNDLILRFTNVKIQKLKTFSLALRLKVQ